MRVAILAALCVALTGCGPNNLDGLSEAQVARCQYEARRATIYQGGILGALQNVEMQQLCGRTAQLENRDAIYARLGLTDAHRGTPIVRARVAGMAEACGMAPTLLAGMRAKAEISAAEWDTGRRLGAGAPPTECAIARASVEAYLRQ